MERRSSSARFLNLAALAARLEAAGDREAAPVLVSPRLRGVLVVKERLAPSVGGSASLVRSATKVVLPFARDQLQLGAWSIVVGEDDWQAKLSAYCGDSGCAASDLATLKLVADLPSLDPFLVREALRAGGLPLREECLQLTPDDASRMQRFVRDEIKRLIDLAYGGGPSTERLTGKLVDALLSSGADERLEPLRQTLQLTAETYQQGLFAWKGFLYYKWILNEHWAPLKESLDGLAAVRPLGSNDAELLKEISAAKLAVRESVKRHVVEVKRYLVEYDRLFHTFTEGGDAAVFRDFLLSARSRFLSLGERSGLLCEFVHVWTERGPDLKRNAMNAASLLELLRQMDVELA